MFLLSLLSLPKYYNLVGLDGLLVGWVGLEEGIRPTGTPVMRTELRSSECQSKE